MHRTCEYVRFHDRGIRVADTVKFVVLGWIMFLGSQIHTHLEHINMALFGNRIFVDVIYKLGGSLTQDDWYFYEKREMWVWRPTQIEKAMCRWRQRLKWWVCKKRIPETAFYHQELGRGKGRCPFTVFRESFALLTLWVWTSNLHKNDRMQFCCFKPSSLWSFVMAVLENKYIF